MKQSHYICYDEDHAIFDILPEFLKFAKEHNMETISEDAYNFKYTYYDSIGKPILKKGGFCRKFTRFELDGETSPSFTIEYRPQKKSHTKRIISHERKSLEELSKMLSINLHYKELKFKGNNYTARIRFHGAQNPQEDNAYYPHLDFIIQVGRVESNKTGIKTPVAFFSMVDTTASVYNNYFANMLIDETEHCIALFDKFMQEHKLKSASTHRYSDLTELITPDPSELLNNQNTQQN